MNVFERRQRLCAAGYTPIPLFGKVPPNKRNSRRGFAAWEQTREVTDEMLEMWSKTWPDSQNTGLITRTTPALDLDILNEEAARALEGHVREHYEERGHILVRIGKAPKRAILFRTLEPFAKFVVNLTAANGSEEKIELLADGAQIAAFGIHPDTKKPYRWHGGEPGEIKLEDLPYIREEEARTLVEELVQILIEQHGYKRAKERPKKARKGGDDIDRTIGAEDWKYLYDNILAGRNLHDSLRDLAAKMVKSGMDGGAAVNALRALMNASTVPHDGRWQERFDDIPRLVRSAEEHIGPKEEAKATAAPVAPASVDETLKVFKRWLLLKDTAPILAVLGAVAANYLDGDPVWLGLIGPPSSAKTEILNATSQLPHVVQVATVTTAALLSGTPKKQAAKGTQGGLLRQIGDFGIISLKDFGSVLSMHTETRLEVLAALREIWDGHWTRHVGSDGGRTLSWKGKVGLIFACTGVIDLHYSVIGAMGDRALLSRFAPAERGQFARSLKHVGAATTQMRKELSEAVAGLFAGRKSEARPISDEEIKQIDRTIMLTVRLRGAVARDSRTRELEAVLGAEGTARIGLALERLLAGLDVLEVERKTALEVVKAVAMDDPPRRVRLPARQPPGRALHYPGCRRPRASHHDRPARARRAGRVPPHQAQATGPGQGGPVGLARLGNRAFLQGLRRRGNAMTAGLLYAFGYLSRKTTTWRDRETLSLCCGAAHHMNWLFGNGPLGHALTASTGFSGTVPPPGRVRGAAHEFLFVPSKQWRPPWLAMLIVPSKPKSNRTIETQ